MYDIELSPAERKFLAFRRRIHPHLYKLKYIGGAMALFGAIGPMLIMLRFFDDLMTANFVVYLCILLGPILYLIGYVYDNGFVRAP